MKQEMLSTPFVCLLAPNFLFHFFCFFLFVIFIIFLLSSAQKKNQKKTNELASIFSIVHVVSVAQRTKRFVSLLFFFFNFLNLSLPFLTIPLWSKVFWPPSSMCLAAFWCCHHLMAFFICFVFVFYQKELEIRK